MAETYEQIIKNLEKLNSSATEYCDFNDCDQLDKEEQTTFTDAALHLAARVREAVGGDPSEWWVKDADGNRVKIGDNFENYDKTEHEVFALGSERVIFEIGNYLTSVSSDLVRKVIPDTREKIIKEAVEELMFVAADNRDQLNEIFGKTVDRAMKLGAEQ